jgi:hypothetical protein
MRMYTEDVAALFGSVPVGTKVWLINEPVKLAYVDGKLLLEVHPPVDGDGQVAQVDPEMQSQKVRAALGQDTAAEAQFERKLPQDVATREAREASRSHAFDSPVPGEHMDM